MQRLGLVMCAALLCTLFATLSPSAAADEASTVSGTVTKVDGSPVAGARVRQIHTGFVYGETTTGSDGSFVMVAGGGFLEVLPPVGRSDMAAFNLDYRNRVPGTEIFTFVDQVVNVTMPDGYWLEPTDRRVEPTPEMPLTAYVPPILDEPDDGMSVEIIDGAIFVALTWGARYDVDLHSSAVPPGHIPEVCCGRPLSQGPYGFQFFVSETGFLTTIEGDPPLWSDPPYVTGPDRLITLSPADGCPAAGAIEWLWFTNELGPAPAAGLPELSRVLPATFSLPAYDVGVRLFVSTGDASLTIGSGTTDGESLRIGGPPPTCENAAASEGYAVLTSTGDVYGFGEVEHRGDPTNGPSTESVAIALTPTGRGYLTLSTTGAIENFGDAVNVGSIDRRDLDAGESFTALEITPTGAGYWITTNTGRVSSFGDARHHGDMREFDLNGEIIAAAATPSGEGYYLVGSDGGIFAFGDAAFVGSVPGVLPGVELDQPVVGITADPDGKGYWLVAADGGVFAFDAPFRGSVPEVLPTGVDLVAAVNGMVPYGNGYLLVAADGGVFNFSNLEFRGSLGDVELASPIVGISATRPG